MTAIEVKLITDSLEELRTTVKTGFENARRERLSIAEDVKVLSDWKNKQQGAEEALVKKEGTSVTNRTAIIAIVAVIVTIIIGFATIYFQLK